MAFMNRFSGFFDRQKQNKNERTSMNNKFDELAKGLAQATTRRQALKKFGAAAAGAVLACFGLARVAEAKDTCIPAGGACDRHHRCCAGLDCQNDGPFFFCGAGGRGG
jgi:hypothetical protein